MTLRITFSLDEREDQDIIAWLGQQENRSGYIRAAIRRDRDRHQTTGSGGLNADQLRHILREELAQVTVGGGNGAAPGGDEDPELAARLDEMF
jgi:Arc/MetJ-type ribon-helix-helix transcriptional regulator